MTAECNQFVFGFHPQKRREIRAQFDGGAITSDGGGLLLRDVEKRIGILRQFAACFTDYRNPDLIEHQVEEMVAQRIYGLALGYEDLNDHEELRTDPLLAVLVEKSHPGNEALAGKSTLNRLELTKETASRKERYKKIVLDHGAVDRLLVEVFLQAHVVRTGSHLTGKRTGTDFIGGFLRMTLSLNPKEGRSIWNGCAAFGDRQWKPRQPSIPPLKVEEPIRLGWPGAFAATK